MDAGKPLAIEVLSQALKLLNRLDQVSEAHRGSGKLSELLVQARTQAIGETEAALRAYVTAPT